MKTYHQRFRKRGTPAVNIKIWPIRSGLPLPDRPSSLIDFLLAIPRHNSRLATHDAVRLTILVFPKHYDEFSPCLPAAAHQVNYLSEPFALQTGVFSTKESQQAHQWQHIPLQHLSRSLHPCLSQRVQLCRKWEEVYFDQAQD